MSKVTLFVDVRTRLTGSATVVYKIPAIWQREGPDSSLGPVLSLLQENFKGTATGKRPVHQTQRYPREATKNYTCIFPVSVRVEGYGLTQICIVTEFILFAVDFLGTAVRFTKVDGVPGPGTGRTRHLRCQPLCADPESVEFSAGHNLKAKTQKTEYLWWV